MNDNGDIDRLPKRDNATFLMGYGKASQGYDVWGGSSNYIGVSIDSFFACICS